MNIDMILKISASIALIAVAYSSIVAANHLAEISDRLFYIIQRLDMLRDAM